MKSISEIEEICRKYGIVNYTINEDGTIDAEGYINLSDRRLAKFPIIFNKLIGAMDCGYNRLQDLVGSPRYVSGYFICASNGLKKLDGSPVNLDGSFNCNFNKLTSLNNGPVKINGSFSCNDNLLTSLEHLPEGITDIFDCGVNNITSLENGPLEVKDYYCHKNELTSLKGCPRIVKQDFNFSNNKIYNIDYFPEYVGDRIILHETPLSCIIGNVVDMDFIKRFDSYKVLKDGRVDLKRLKYLMKISDMEYDLEKIKEHYEII